MIDPKLTLQYHGANRSFTVESRAVAAFVWLDPPGTVRGHFSENAFWMLPGAKEVTFEAYEDLPAGWWKNVTITSVWDLR